MAHILLLAEPSLTIQRVVQLTFANEDIDVIVASDGAEAVEQAERVRPSIVLADVALPRKTGYEVAAHFKRHPRFAGVPVVLLSGAFERADPARAAECGCDLVLNKPFEPKHLLAHVKELLRGAPGGDAPEEVAPDVATRATAAGFVPAASSSGNAAGIDPLPAPPASAAPVPTPSAPPTPTVDELMFSLPPVVAVTDAFREHARSQPVVPEAAPAVVPEPADVTASPVAPAAPDPLPPVLPDRMQPEPSDTPKVARRPVEQPPALEPVPSFEMLALTNKAMRLVPPPAAPDEPDPEPDAAEPEPVREAQPVRATSHDLGDLIPSLDDYFDQLDAAFASGGDTAFRRPPDAVPPPEPPMARHVPAPRPPMAQPAPPLPPPMPVPPPASVRQEPLMEPPPPAFVDRRKSAPVPEPVEERGPAVSPFSTLRLEPPDPRPAPASSATIDDAYDALMKQLQEPKPRPSVVALRADDELLVERAVERVLAQLNTDAMREAMTDVVTNLTKKVIAEEIERIRRP